MEIGVASIIDRLIELWPAALASLVCCLWLPTPLFAGSDEHAASIWDKSVTLRGGLGYDDNVLLSTDNEQRSPFWDTGLELMLFRLPVDQHQFYFFLSAEDRRFLKKSIETGKEQTVIAVTQYDYQVTEDWDAGIGLQYLFQDEVFDVSATEATLTTIPLTAHSVELSPSVARQLSDSDEVELELAVRRQFFHEPLDDYWEGGPEITWQHDYGSRSEIELTYAFSWRFYDTRSQRNADGLLLPGTSLEFRSHEIELSNQHYWDKSRRWRTESEIGVDLNFDNDSNYFGYRRYFAEQGLRYQREIWEVEAEAGISYYDYRHQRVSRGNRDNRERASVDASLRAERTLWKELTGYAKLEYQRALSNRATEEYEATTIVTGIDWRF